MIVSRQLNTVFSNFWNNQALICGQQNITYGELYNKAAFFVEWLKRQGAQEGDFVALRLDNGALFATWYIACILGGFNFAPVNPELSTDDQEYIVSKIDPKVLIDSSVSITHFQPTSASSPEFSTATDHVKAVFFTSGTTGRPKGVVHHLSTLVDNALAFCHFTGLSSTTRMYHILPMAYMAGFLNTLLCPWLVGGCTVIGPRFAPRYGLDFWSGPISQGVNAIWLTPTIAAVITRMSRGEDTASKVSGQMTHIFCGTAPLPEVVRNQFINKFNCPLQQSFGMSEILFVSVQTREDAVSFGDVGKLMPGVSVDYIPVLNNEGRELVIHTPWVLKKYLLEDGEYSPLLENGGMPTGDMAEYFEGRLKVTGRIKDLIIRGGVNVSPAAIEEVLLSDRGVKDAAVVGVPDDVWGEKIVACIVSTDVDKNEETQTRLASICKQNLANGMLPDAYIWLKELPRSPNGKIQKIALRERLA